FKSKQQMALELISEGRKRILTVIQQGYRKDAGMVEDMVKASTRLMTDLLNFALENKYFMALLWLKGQGADQPIRDEVSKTRRAFVDAFRNNVERAIELGMLPATMNVELRVIILTSMIEGTICNWLFGPMNSTEHVPTHSVEETADELARFEFFGLLGK
ncbi:MAG: TetR family transcriptional regulator, partial [Alicyclobacillus sp.]|nr:TetR family transcriptional regulator [Alicyclobacillus sp.]